MYKRISYRILAVILFVLLAWFGYAKFTSLRYNAKTRPNAAGASIAFAPECVAIDLPRITKDIKAKKVEIVNSGVTRQETVEQVQTTCPLAVTSSGGSQQMSVSIQRSKDPKKKIDIRSDDQKTTQAKNLSILQTVRVANLGDVAYYSERKSGSAVGSYARLVIGYGSTKITLSTTSYNAKQGLLSKDDLIVIARQVLSAR